MVAEVVVERHADLPDVVDALRALAASRAALIAGSNKATKIAMMAITTSNSTSVKPRSLDLDIYNLLTSIWAAYHPSGLAAPGTK